MGQFGMAPRCGPDPLFPPRFLRSPLVLGQHPMPSFCPPPSSQANNVEVIVERMMTFLRTAATDEHIKKDIVRKVWRVC